MKKNTKLFFCDITQNLKHMLIFLLLIAATINFNMPIPKMLSKAGYINIYLIELIVPCFVIFMLISYLKKEYTLNNREKKILVFTLIFILAYAIITILRIVLRYEYKQSMMALRISIFPISIIYIISFFKIEKKDIIYNLIAFNFFINII
ncbi:MAG: hypothetical protein RR623_09830, partial [Bacilli bacterium]